MDQTQKSKESLGSENEELLESQVDDFDDLFESQVEEFNDVPEDETGEFSDDNTKAEENKTWDYEPPHTSSNFKHADGSSSMVLNTPSRPQPRTAALPESKSSQKNNQGGSKTSYQPPPGSYSRPMGQTESVTPVALQIAEPCHCNNPMQLSNVNLRNYQATAECNQDIIFGEREKEHVKAVGLELLSMGKRILEEIDIAENLNVNVNSKNKINKEQVSNTGVGASKTNTRHNQGSHPLQSQAALEDGDAFDGNRKKNQRFVQELEDSFQQTDDILKSRNSECWNSEIEKNKQDFIEAFGRICYSIGQAKEKHRNRGSKSNCNLKPSGYTKVKDVESTLSSIPDQPLRHHSKIEPNEYMPHPILPSTPTDERLGNMTISIKKISPGKDNGHFPIKGELSENWDRKDLPNVANDMKLQQMTDRLTALEVKFNEFEVQVEELMKTNLEHNTGMTNKIEDIDHDILHLAKLIHELQCVTRLQMHLGGADH